jgi:ADP-heptose:LPS heptosyltransferase
LDRQTFITKPVLPSLAVSELVKIERNSVKPIVVIVVGAEWKYRHYDNWVTIVSQLVSDYEILLLGSINGLKDASAILSEFPECINYVGNRTLSETVSIISQAKVVFAADGGLWHVACALGKPSVVLFAAMPLFNESGVRVNRDTADMLCEVVYDDNQVSDIDPQKIMKAFERLIDRI